MPHRNLVINLGKFCHAYPVACALRSLQPSHAARCLGIWLSIWSNPKQISVADSVGCALHSLQSPGAFRSRRHKQWCDGGGSPRAGTHICTGQTSASCALFLGLPIHCSNSNACHIKVVDQLSLCTPDRMCLQ